MNEKVTSSTFASTQKVNDIIKKTYNKSSYSIENKFHSNDEYDYDNEEMTQNFRKLVEKIKKTTINIKNNATKVANNLKEVISNDVIKEGEISLSLRFKSRQQNITIEKERTSSIYHNY